MSPLKYINNSSKTELKSIEYFYLADKEFGINAQRIQ